MGTGPVRLHVAARPLLVRMQCFDVPAPPGSRSLRALPDGVSPCRLWLLFSDSMTPQRVRAWRTSLVSPSTAPRLHSARETRPANDAMQHRKGVRDLTWHRPPRPSAKGPRTSTATALQLGCAASELQRPQEAAGCTGNFGRTRAVYIAKPAHCFERNFANRTMVGQQQRHPDSSE